MYFGNLETFLFIESMYRRSGFDFCSQSENDIARIRKAEEKRSLSAIRQKRFAYCGRWCDSYLYPIFGSVSIIHLKVEILQAFESFRLSIMDQQKEETHVSLNDLRIVVGERRIYYAQDPDRHCFYDKVCTYLDQVDREACL